ncbi:MAG: sialidase family protein [Chthonomonadales bacterium]
MPKLIAPISIALLATAIICRTNIGASTTPAPTVSVESLPNGAIQPQALVDSKGIVHLVYYKGAPEAGDLFYVHYPSAEGIKSATTPVRVNSDPATAMATGTIRSEQIAIGGDGRIHVVWNGLAPKNGKAYAPMYLAYTRLNGEGTAFEKQRNLCQWTGNLDGGSTVAADARGNVYAFWHTAPPEIKTGEGARGVFLTVSHDGGTTFSREKMVNPDPTGACACCSMKATTDAAGRISVLYRAARNSGTERDTMLMTSTDRGQTFTNRSIDAWPINACPMSSYSQASLSGGETLLGWETKEQVFTARLLADGKSVTVPLVAPGISKSKHPVVAGNANGDTLFAWTEGTGWAKGGSFSWQLMDKSGKLLGARGHMEGLPAWTLLSAYAKPDGSFVIVH